MTSKGDTLLQLYLSGITIDDVISGIILTTGLEDIPMTKTFLSAFLDSLRARSDLSKNIVDIIPAMSDSELQDQVDEVFMCLRSNGTLSEYGLRPSRVQTYQINDRGRKMARKALELFSQEDRDTICRLGGELRALIQISVDERKRKTGDDTICRLGKEHED